MADVEEGVQSSLLVTTDPSRYHNCLIFGQLFSEEAVPDGSFR